MPLHSTIGSISNDRPLLVSVFVGCGIFNFMLIGYARVSTRDQNPQLQIDALTASGCERIYTEYKSGANLDDRPELQNALSFMRKGDTLVVWKLDRLARSLRQLLQTIDSLSEKGIEFKCITTNIDTTTPTGKLLFHLLAVLAEFERSLLIERTLAGMESARQGGRVGGRPKVLKPHQVEAARAMRKEMTMPQIAKTFGVGVSTLHRYLSTPTGDSE